MSIKLYLSAFLLFLSQFVIAQIDLNKDLLIHYPFNGNTLNSEQDLFHLEGAPVAFLEGINGEPEMAFSFNSNETRKQLFSNDTINLTEELTISFTTKNNFDYSTFTRFAGNRSRFFGANFNNLGFGIGFPTCTLFVNLDTLSCTETYYFEDFIVNSNQWHNLVFVITDTTITSYFDNQSQTFARNADCKVNLDGNFFSTQTFSDDGISSNATLVTDDLRFYNRALSDEEVQALLILNSSNITGINSLVGKNIIIHPNPAQNKLFISNTDIKSLEIISQTTGKSFSSSLEDNHLDISNLTEGVYFLKLISNEEVFILPFVKQF